MTSLKHLFGLAESDQTYKVEQWHIPYGKDSRLAYRQRLRHWILMIFAGVGGMPAYCEAGQSKHYLIAEICDLPELADPNSSVSDIQSAIGQATAQWLNQSPNKKPPEVAACNQLAVIDWLAKSAGLSPLERDIFEFCVAMKTFAPLRTAIGHWGNLPHGDVINGLSALLGHTDLEVGHALESCGNLVRCGLLRVSYYEEPMDNALRVPTKLVQRIPLHRTEPELILSHLVRPMVQPTLTLADFSHMELDTQLAQCWLGGAMHAASRQQNAGHLLVNGAPGLGKTEWVRALLKQAQAKALELSVLHDNGTALTGEDRLSHLQLAMRLLRSTPNGVLIFDEADDVFSNQHELGNEGDKQAVSMANHRASLNRLIEDSQVPVIWIMNNPEVLDAAVLRRFDAVISFTEVPRSVREKMLKQRGLWSDADINAWAPIHTLTPALIDRLASVKTRAEAAGQIMSNDLCGHWLRRRLPGKSTQHLGTTANQVLNSVHWNAKFVNASEDLLALAEGIKRCGSARILLYGPPGTGKTAYAHALASLIDRPLMEQRASDLLSAYVGETEQRISQAFNKAMEDSALLFIDEADSLLANRGNAMRNWEVMQVNELLEQLGDYAGVAVIATNRLDALDAAVLRRLDAKIKFEALKPEQLRDFFAAICQKQGFVCDGEVLQVVETLEAITPGDFACIERRLAFAPPTPKSQTIETPAELLLKLLKEEIKLKSGNRSAMGFLALKQNQS